MPLPMTFSQSLVNPLEQPIEQHSKKSWGSCCKKRHIVMAVVAFKVLLMSALGSMFPLAVIAMVKRPNNTVNSTDCPINTNVTVNDSGGNENGEFDWDELTQSYIFAVGGVGTLMSMLVGARLCELYGVKFVVGISMVITAVLTLLSPSAARLSVWLFIVINFTKGVFSVTQVCQKLDNLWQVTEVCQTLNYFWQVTQGCQTLNYFWQVTQGCQTLNYFWQVIKVCQTLNCFCMTCDSSLPNAEPILAAMILGTLIPMFTAGELMEKFGWPSVYYLSGLSVIPFMITWVFFVYDTPHHHPTISNEEKSYIIKNSQRDYGSSFISALPHLANLASNVLCSTLSHWLRMKGFISQITAYRIFNFFATVGTAVAMIVVAQLGCNAEATVSVLVVTMTLNGAYFGGSFMNLLDLGSNFSGSLSAYSGTLIGTMTIVAPLITGAIINTNQTRSSWGNVFYVSAAVSTIPFFIFYFLGSVEEQPWNVIHKEEDEEAIVEVGPEDETNAYDPEH
uniref:Uncharacterized protein n=1 Tax=Timema cristinae TaxID=61476 RepID=A0A7R9CCI0_TIMCR|nr:unnamed protein product [Timema cristinae]